MAGNLTFAEVRQILTGASPLADPFPLLRSIGTRITFAADPAGMNAARELVILMLSRRAELNGYSEVLDSLATSVGLYPYADPTTLSGPQLVEYESRRPIGMEDTVFHAVQAQVYFALMDGESVVLSAPTSFGKSLIIDALLSSGRFNNVAVIVPTIALIDETRRRLTRQFRDHYRVLTHPGQELGERNILVMTQERILDVEELPDLDLFVIDEFYKLDPSAGDPNRANLLNQAFYRLRRTGAQFYLLGPSVQQVPVQLNEVARVILTDFNTVSLDIRSVPATNQNRLDVLVSLCSQLSDPTLIYCRSPAQARRVAQALSEAFENAREVMPDAVRWIGEHYHPAWSFVRAMRTGVGLHHGRIPRSLGQLAVRAFNAGQLPFLVCTSTLIEGVNTAAKNVVIYDNYVGSRRYDFFTFNNIRGRSGRMFQHFVGHVYVFHEPPTDDLRSVDVPVVTQEGNVDPSLLIQLDPEELTEQSRIAIDDLLTQQELPLEDIRKSNGIDPELLVALARRLRGETQLRRSLHWTGYPSWDQLLVVCRLIWNDLGGSRLGRIFPYLVSERQLAFRLSRLRSDDFSGLIESQLTEAEDPDEAVEAVLDFVRQWAGFHFPRLLMVLERVSNRVATDLGEPQASYGFYAAQVESLFRPRPLVVLEEYGLPIQIGDKLHQLVDLDVSLDDALDRVRQIEAGQLALTDPFEVEMVKDVQSNL